MVSDQLVTHAAETGRRVRSPRRREEEACSTRWQPTMTCSWPVSPSILSTAARVDLSWCDGVGVEFLRMSDIPVGSETGTVLCQQSITMAKASRSNTLIARLVAVDEKAGERLLGEYAFHHTRTIPGPPGSE